MKYLLLIFSLVLLVTVSSSNAIAIKPPFELAVSKNIFDANIYGVWNVDSEVISSNCPFVGIGTTAKSKLKITLHNGKLKPVWISSEWKLLESGDFQILSDNRFSFESENYLNKFGKLWKVKTKDELVINSEKDLEVKSKVKQYMNGKYVGTYEMLSQLRRPGFDYDISLLQEESLLDSFQNFVMKNPNITFVQ